MKSPTFIAFGSWEERFLLGAKHLCGDGAVTQIIIPYAVEYAERTEPNRTALRDFAKECGLPYEEFPIALSTSIGCWTGLSQAIPAKLGADRDVLLDISTFPREAIWYVLHILDALGSTITWRYHRPRPNDPETPDTPPSYGTWLSRNAQSPRVLLKRSGVALPGRKTCIVALAGFDTERLAQLIEKYEPACCLVGRQTGDQFGNKKRNTGFDAAFVDQRQIDIFDFNCFDGSLDALDQLENNLPSSIWEEFNVLGASLGPKPSAITMFQLSQRHPELGLVYILAGEYNPNYSVGIDLSTASAGVISPNNGATT